MNGLLSPDNIATRKGSFAVEVSLLFQLPSTTVCTTEFLDTLAGAIVTSVGRTSKSLLRLYCSQSTVKVQILSTYVPIKSLRSNDDVALELQRQLSFSGSPFRTNVSGVDPSFRPPPLRVTNCSEDALLFQSSCGRLPVHTATWLGLEPYSSSTFLIFAAAALLVCLLFAICTLCLRRFLKDRTRVEDKAKWIVAVQKEQAQELQGAKVHPIKESSDTSSAHQLLPIQLIAIPTLPVSAHATPSPSPRSVPPLQDPDSNIYQSYDDVYMETPPSKDGYGSEAEIEASFVLEECCDVILEPPDCQTILDTPHSVQHLS